ncbi:MAG: hypothetical protein DWB56_06920 [Candidatus Jettenia sp.]|uniref:Putative heme protein n=1 Tax=Candidatus Jettenia caeni TaxID=247490 RepID=I3IMW7_9BACT|nr:cytochrome c3 family protein [Candidatus Jettenia sp. AMX1]MBC6928686.1 hypothetical protein [Candidatus Jettenia sp.]NUN23437.1 hypothetical protein [Candidatus Jettenia caeni]KAA0250664.1 MAG: hypothetical protein EDM77_03860 [Candidatus Jettenia sp. AMX1]MCE7879998.1 hypothetical protein [Candidatus Jettenia sp. AMX1]MCQ3926780.1 hypothetical protein [Candidatus Jettenia sp.]
MKKTITVVLLTTMVIIILIWAVGLRFPTHIYSPDDLHKDHQGIQDCRQCHIPFKGAASGLCMTSDCHTIDRLSQLSNKLLSDLHISYARQDCLHCHTEHKGIAGKITKPFDHKTIDVSILHECFACHTVDYQKAHPGKYNTDCNMCHISTTGWKIISFNHNTILGKTACTTCHSMPKDEKHKKFPETCETCHTTKNWREILFNHDALDSMQVCIECHKKPSDNLHATISEDCRVCHSTKKWKPANFDHDTYFPLTGDHCVSCNICHQSGNYQQYTCLNCHEHNTSHIRHEHEEHGIYDYGNCLRCHKMTVDGKSYGNPAAEAYDDEGDEGEDD